MDLPVRGRVYADNGISRRVEKMQYRRDYAPNDKWTS